jgi:hypothetical protein
MYLQIDTELVVETKAANYPLYAIYLWYEIVDCKPNHMRNGFSQAVAPSDKVGKKKENPQKIPQTSFE